MPADVDRSYYAVMGDKDLSEVFVERAYRQDYLERERFRPCSTTSTSCTCGF